MDNETRRPEPSELSDEDFVQAYQENGFGWTLAPNQEAIRARHKQLRETRPDLYPSEAQYSASAHSDESHDQVREPVSQPLLQRNFEGQVVDPKTNEPVRKGSPEWQELARKNQLPHNQDEQK